jgi:hypothetical protein
MGLLGLLAGCGGDEAADQGLVATWELRQVASGMEGVTTLHLKRDGSYDYDVVHGSQRQMDRGGWIADDTRLTLAPTSCSAGPPCPTVAYQYTLGTAGKTLILMYTPMPGGGTATLTLSRK